MHRSSARHALHRPRRRPRVASSFAPTSCRTALHVRAGRSCATSATSGVSGASVSISVFSSAARQDHAAGEAQVEVIGARTSDRSARNNRARRASFSGNLATAEHHALQGDVAALPGERGQLITFGVADLDLARRGQSPSTREGSSRHLDPLDESEGSGTSRSIVPVRDEFRQFAVRRRGECDTPSVDEVETVLGNRVRARGVRSSTPTSRRSGGRAVTRACAIHGWLRMRSATASGSIRRSGSAGRDAGQGDQVLGCDAQVPRDLERCDGRALRARAGPSAAATRRRRSRHPSRSRGTR